MGVKIVDTALRDGPQSLIATRMTTEEVLAAAKDMEEAGYYAMEVWGGATFDACLRFLNEDPWERLREIRKVCKKTKLQMLFRGQNILGYHHYADDVVEKFVQKSIENGFSVTLDNGKINWYNVDLENSANYRLKYIKDTDRVKTLAYSAMDPNWSKEIEIRNDVLFIVEGLTMYLNQKDVEDIINIIDADFDKCTIFMEIMPPISVKNAKEESIEDTNSKFIWGVEKGHELTKFNSNFRWIKDVNLFDGVNVYKPHYRIITWLPYLRKKMDYIAVLEK